MFGERRLIKIPLCLNNLPFYQTRRGKDLPGQLDRLPPIAENLVVHHVHELQVPS